MISVWSCFLNPWAQQFTVLKLKGKGTPDLVIHHWKRRILHTKACKEKQNTSSACNWACMAPCWFQMCRCKWLWITASGLAENFTYHSFAFAYKSIVLSWKSQYKHCKHIQVINPASSSPIPSTGWVLLHLLQDLASNCLGFEIHNGFQCNLGWIEIGPLCFAWMSV